MRSRTGVVVIVAVLGLACSSTGASEDEAGVTTNASGDQSDEGSSSDEGSTFGTSTSTDTGADTDTDTSSSSSSEADTDSVEDESSDDAPQVPDLPLPPQECTTEWIEWADIAEYPDCGIDPDNGQGCWTEPMLGCAPPGPNGCDCPDGDCIETWESCSGEWWLEQPYEVCGPYMIDGMCCSIGEFLYGCGE